MVGSKTFFPCMILVVVPRARGGLFHPVASVIFLFESSVFGRGVLSSEFEESFRKMVVHLYSSSRVGSSDDEAGWWWWPGVGGGFGAGTIKLLHSFYHRLRLR